MDIAKIDRILEELNAPKYRRKQILDAVCKQFIGSWGEISTLPKPLAEALEKEIPFMSLSVVKEVESEKKDTVKVLFRTKTKVDEAVEAVLMKHDNDRRTVCISSQAGCGMNCTFCATGQNGFFRNLTVEEMLDQVLFFCRYAKARGERVTNIVFMGMGEPFTNYDRVIEVIKLFNGKDYLNIGMRHISVSTCGVVPGIERFAKEHIQANLAISLHAPDDETRSKLMPINKAFPIERLLKSVDHYIAETRRKVMFEYLLIDGVNDSEETAKKLAKLMNKKLYHVNLIKYHATSGLSRQGEAKADPFRTSPKERRDKFFDILKKAGISCTFRISFGEDIQAACGQLAGAEKSR